MNTTFEELLVQYAPSTTFEKPRAPMGACRGNIIRQKDETGISGTGPVAQVCVFADGQCAVQWVCPPAAGKIDCMKWESWLDVHVRQHPTNRTIIIWEDGTYERYDPPEPPSSE